MIPEIKDEPIYRVTEIDGEVWYSNPDFDKCFAYILTHISRTPFDKTFVIVKPNGDKNIYRIRLDLSLLSPDGTGVAYFHTGYQIGIP
jgi:hypothetical protein